MKAANYIKPELVQQNHAQNYFKKHSTMLSQMVEEANVLGQKSEINQKLLLQLHSAASNARAAFNNLVMT